MRRVDLQHLKVKIKTLDYWLFPAKERDRQELRRLTDLMVMIRRTHRPKTLVPSTNGDKRVTDVQMGDHLSMFGREFVPRCFFWSLIYGS